VYPVLISTGKPFVWPSLVVLGNRENLLVWRHCLETPHLLLDENLKSFLRQRWCLSIVPFSEVTLLENLFCNLGVCILWLFASSCCDNLIIVAGFFLYSYFYLLDVCILDVMSWSCYYVVAEIKCNWYLLHWYVPLIENAVVMMKKHVNNSSYCATFTRSTEWKDIGTYRNIDYVTPNKAKVRIYLSHPHRPLPQH
jgi:hypothetical protein